jgi:hypothetical protein
MSGTVPASRARLSWCAATLAVLINRPLGMNVGEGHRTLRLFSSFSCCIHFEETPLSAERTGDGKDNTTSYHLCVLVAVYGIELNRRRCAWVFGLRDVDDA